MAESNHGSQELEAIQQFPSRKGPIMKLDRRRIRGGVQIRERDRVGAHALRPGGRVLPPPPPEPAAARRPGTPMPQRERMTYLIRLNERFVQFTGLLTVFALIDGYPVLTVIPRGTPGQAITVGCRYRDGQWWFYDVRTGTPIRPANALDAAAHQIKAAMRRAAR